MTGFLDFVKWENNILTYHGISFLGIGMLIVFWVIIFAVSKRISYDSIGALVASSFATTILAIMFFIAGLINTQTVLIFIGLLVVGIVLLRISE
jgi:hypothetical protein